MSILNNDFLVSVTSNETLAPMSPNLESKWLSFGNKWMIATIVLPHANRNVMQQPLWMKCKNNCIKNIPFMVVHEELDNMHFLGFHKLFYITFNERFEIGNLLNQTWNKKINCDSMRVLMSPIRNCRIYSWELQILGDENNAPQSALRFHSWQN